MEHPEGSSVPNGLAEILQSTGFFVELIDPNVYEAPLKDAYG